MPKFHEPIKDFNPLPYPRGDVVQFFFENSFLYSQPPMRMKGHNGWDIVREWGTPVMCVEGGKIVDVRSDFGGNGKHVRILSENNEWIYGHLSLIEVQLGQQVQAGDQIGRMGNTGFVVSGNTPFWENNPYAGTHLHLSRYPLTPYSGTGSWNRSYPTGDRAVMTYSGNGYNDAYDFSSTDFSVAWRFDKNLAIGMKNHDVFELQTRLGMSTVTGFFGTQTLAAVVRCQRSYGILPTGFVGPITRKSLNK